ncbi:MAG: serine/threonine protein kinase [Deltaproteobacteria bacterium]|nr:serine/threonine protein kinase [Deltaproteobacteria bacterium]
MTNASRRPSHSHHARVGELVDGRYRIEGALGRGAWSMVYDAVHWRTGQQVALKMLLRNLPVEDQAAETRFFREAQIMASLQHPNTLRVFDVGRTAGGALYIASQRLKGPTLEEVFTGLEREGRAMPPAELAPILEAILSSLAEAHDKGLVHRDIKPGNVMLHEVADEHFVKVLDFGIAMLVADAAKERSAGVGTPDAMSPEQCAGQELDPRSDLYAVAALAYRGLCGRPVFEGEDAHAVLEMHRSSPVPDPRQVAPQPISDGLAAWVRQGLAKHPKDRFGDARAMRTALRAAMSGEPTPAPGKRHRSSSWQIPAVKPEIVTTKDTGRWRVERKEPVTAATQVLPADAALPRSTAKYAAVDAATLAAHRAAPALAPEPTPPSDPDAAQAPSLGLLDRLRRLLKRVSGLDS